METSERLKYRLGEQNKFVSFVKDHEIDEMRDFYFQRAHTEGDDLDDVEVSEKGQ